MADLGSALNLDPDILFLGGGNPAKIDAFESVIKEHLIHLVNDQASLHSLLGIYQSPRGSESMIIALTRYLQSEGWPVSEENIAVTHGSQSALFIILNSFAGAMRTEYLSPESSGSTCGESLGKKICLPLLPEYLGYADQGISRDIFRAFPPKIELIGEHLFKYHIDFDGLNLDACGAICLSRPTNPSGNVPSCTEMRRLKSMADEKGIPLIVDCAYGAPFPGLLHIESPLQWQPNMVMVLSLSKLGLPGTRTGIVVADKPVIDIVSNMSTVMSLSNGNLGPALLTSLIERQQLNMLRDDIIIPFYQRKRDFILGCIEQTLYEFPYRMHSSEGAFFIWIWFRDLPVSSTILYQRLKKRSVLVMDGSHFFFGLEDTAEINSRNGATGFSRHQKECLRLTYCQPDDVIAQAITILAEELKDLYTGVA